MCSDPNADPNAVKLSESPTQKRRPREGGGPSTAYAQAQLDPRLRGDDGLKLTALCSDPEFNCPKMCSDPEFTKNVL